MDRLEHVLRPHRLLRRELVRVVRQVADEDRGGFRQGEQGILLDRRVGGQNAAGQTRGQGAGEEEVL